jgi:hypothetical protein
MITQKYAWQMDLKILSHKIFFKRHNVMMWRGEIAIMSTNVVATLDNTLH